MVAAIANSFSCIPTICFYSSSLLPRSRLSASSTLLLWLDEHRGSSRLRRLRRSRQQHVRGFHASAPNRDYYIMGAFLSKPITTVQTEFRRGNGLQMLAGAVQGWRVGMEDAHACRMQLVDNVDSPLNKWSGFCMFDGHAGAGAAMYCAENLLENLLQHSSMQTISRGGNTANNNNHTDTGKSSLSNSLQNNSSAASHAQNNSYNVDTLVESALKDTFVQIDSKYRNSLDRIVSADHSGTTGVCCLISPQTVYIANCGDSRAIMVSGAGTAVAANHAATHAQQQHASTSAAATAHAGPAKVVLATRDHKPDNPEERERIEKAGGTVVMGRVQGNLAVSRAIGDFDYKNNVDLPPTQQLVSCVPDVYIRKRDRANDQFLLIACDGLWDVFQNQEAADFVRHLLTITKPGADQTQRLMDRLLHTAINKDSRDNITALIVGLDAMPQYDAECEAHEQQCDAFIQRKLAEYIERNGPKDPHMSFRDVLNMLSVLEHIPHLPPGGGLVSKYEFVEHEFNRLKPPPPPAYAQSSSVSSTTSLSVPVSREVSSTSAAHQSRSSTSSSSSSGNKMPVSNSSNSPVRKSNNNLTASSPAGHVDMITARDSERLSAAMSSATMPRTMAQQQQQQAGTQASSTSSSSGGGTAHPTRTREITIVVEPARVSGESATRQSSDGPAPRRLLQTAVYHVQHPENAANSSGSPQSQSSSRGSAERSSSYSPLRPSDQQQAAKASRSNTPAQQQQQDNAGRR